MISSKTVSGLPVTLTGVHSSVQPLVRVELNHPSFGYVEFFALSHNQGEVRGYSRGWQKVCVTIPREDFDAALAEAAAL